MKRSVTIAGHESSITLEPVFWTALEAIAQRRALPLNALIAEIDLWRFGGGDAPLTNLSSALRQWVYAESIALSEVANASSGA